MSAFARLRDLLRRRRATDAEKAERAEQQARVQRELAAHDHSLGQAQHAPPPSEFGGFGGHS